MPFFSISSPSSGNATQLQGRAVSATAPATGSILAWSGSAWAPGGGVTGPTGARGDDGARIWSGTGAPAAGFGASGDFWVDTTNGRLYGPKADGSWGTPLQLQSGPAGPQGVTGPVSTVPGPTGSTGAASTVPGPTGPASTVTGPTGARGATLLAGDGAPLSNYGTDGDWYIDTVAADFYGPKAGGAWGQPTIDLLAITGPTGAQGAPSTVTGPTGVAGQSIVGPTGSVGATGPQGNSITGPTGPQGEAIVGPTGPQGNSITGPTGAASTVPGPTGPQGDASTVPGPTGPQGLSITGPTGPTPSVSWNDIGDLGESSITSSLVGVESLDTVTFATPDNLNNVISQIDSALSGLAAVATSGDASDLGGVSGQWVVLGNNNNLYDLIGDIDSQLQQRPTSGELATVAFSGSYGDLSGLPTLFDGSFTSLTGTPSTFTPSAHKTSHATGGSDALTAADIGAAAATHTHAASAISDSTTAGRALLTAAGATEQRTALGLGTLATASSVSYASLTGTPSTFTPSAHAHGNVTNAGAIGSTSGQIVVTGSGGVMTTAATITADQVTGIPAAAAAAKPDLITNRTALRRFYSRYLNAIQNTGGNRRVSVALAGDSLAGRLAGWLASEIQSSAQFWGSTASYLVQAAGPLWTGGYSPKAGINHNIVGLGLSYSPATTNPGPVFSGGWMTGVAFDVSAPVTLSATGSGTSLTVTGASVSTTATASSGSATVTVASASGIYLGMTATGTGIPASTTVVGISGTTITLSANTSAALSSTSVTFALPISSTLGRMTVTGNANIAAGTEATAISGSTVTLSAAATGSVSGTVTLSSYLQFPGPSQFGSNLAQRFGVYYIQQTGGGSFVLEYSTSATGATWTQVGGTYNTSGSLAGVVATAALPSRNRYWFRARVTSGTVRFVGGWFDDGANTTRGFTGIGLSAGGISPQQMNTCEAAIVSPLMAHLDPALMTYHVDDLSYSSTLGPLLAKMRGTVTTTASGTNGGSTITVASATGLYVGMTVTSSDRTTIPGSVITAISGTTITLSLANASTFSGVAVTIETPIPTLVIANHAKLGEDTATTRASVTDLQNAATTYNYAVFDALTALGTASQLQSLSQIGDGTHLDPMAYSVGGHFLLSDLMAPIHSWISGKTWTNHVSAATVGANTIRIGDINNGDSYLSVFGPTIPPALITTAAYNLYVDCEMNFSIRAYNAGATQFRITNNPYSQTNMMPNAPIYYPSSSDISAFSPYGSLTGGVTTWAHGQNFKIKNNNNNQRLHLGPFVNSLSLDLPSIAAASEYVATVTVTGVVTTTNTVVHLGWSGTLPTGIIVAQAWVSASNAVSIRFYNYTAGAIDPAALTCNVAVMEVATS